MKKILIFLSMLFGLATWGWVRANPVMASSNQVVAWNKKAHQPDGFSYFIFLSKSQRKRAYYWSLNHSRTKLVKIGKLRHFYFTSHGNKMPNQRLVVQRHLKTNRNRIYYQVKVHSKHHNRYYWVWNGYFYFTRLPGYGLQ